MWWARATAFLPHSSCDTPRRRISENLSHSQTFALRRSSRKRAFLLSRDRKQFSTITNEIEFRASLELEAILGHVAANERLEALRIPRLMVGGERHCRTVFFNGFRRTFQDLLFESLGVHLYKIDAWQTMLTDERIDGRYRYDFFADIRTGEPRLRE